MAEAKTIYCPECKRRVAFYDGKQTNYINALCRKCFKRVIYKPDTDEIVVKDRPLRTTSGGMRV